MERRALLLVVAACIVALIANAMGKMQWDVINHANTNVEKHNILYTMSVTIDGEEIPTGYKVLVRSGEPDPAGSDAVFGQQYDREGNPIFKINETTFERDSELEISNDQDFTSFLRIGDRLFSIAHFETPQPAATYLVELGQDAETGELSILSFENMDWTGFEGIWHPCAGSVTPWETHMGSEEFGPNSRLLALNGQEEWDVYVNASNSDAGRIIQFMRWYGRYPLELTYDFIVQNFNPYFYGYPWEATVNEDGSYSVMKHFSMGRTSVELPFVMPDNQTAYIMDDGTNRVLTVYKADTPGDLSSGTLYAAKVTQTSDFDGGIFDVEWISLGSASDDEIGELAATLTFNDIFEYVAPNVTVFPDNDGCPEGFNSVNVGDEHECLILKDGMETAASRLDTRRYAALQGATTEWSKMEGFSYSPLRRRAYMAMSDIREGMEDNMRKGEENDRHDVGGRNDIRLPYNPCGCVYQLDLDEDFLITMIVPLICGIPDLTEGIPDNRVCHIDGIANPDNLAVVNEHDGIIIGEDTNFHQNDVIWYLDLKTRELQRLLSTPYGSETTSPYYYPDINGWAYIMTVVQHPYEGSDREKIFEPENTGVDGYMGYIGPLPAVVGTDRS